MNDARHPPRRPWLDRYRAVYPVLALLFGMVVLLVGASGRLSS